MKGNRTEYEYDIEGRSQVVKDRLGNSTVYVYDGDGNILQKTDANGNTEKNTYDKQGNLLTRTDAMGNTTKYSYDGNGNITSVTDAEGNQLAATYNERNLITSMKSGDDEIVIDYDKQGNIAETTDLAGNTTEYDYDENGNVEGIADSIGNIASAKHDKDGNVTESTDSAGQKTAYTYDGDGNRLSVTRYVETEEGTKEETTRYVYNGAGDLVQTVSPNGNVTAITRDASGRMTETIDEQGRRTNYEYTDNGDVSRVCYADGTEETFTYDAEGQVLTSVNRLGQKETYEYDKAGNLKVSTDSRGNRTTYAYDKNYNVLSVTEPSGAATTYTYDALNRNTAVTDAAGNTTAFTYNKYSFLTGVTDAKGNETRYEYNGAGNRIRTIYPDGSSVQSGYDKRGRTIWQEDAAGIRTGYTYDSADRLTGVHTDAAGTTTYEYDRNGNLASVTDANGNKVSYTYDGQGRLVKTTQPDGSTGTNTYDGYGRLTESTDYNGAVTTYEYDGQDRVTRETKKTGKTGEPSAVKTYAYDKYGRLTKVSAGDSTIRYSYNRYGELSEKSYENGQKLSYDYDSLGRKSHITVSSGSGDTLGETSYGYDRMNRITRVIAKDGTATVYTYDANGNRETATFANGVAVTYEYDALNRLLVQKTVDRTGELIAQYRYTLDRNGRRTKVSEEGEAGSRETSYTYDGAGRLAGEKTVSVDAAGRETVTGYAYEYDSVGNRVSKTAETKDGSAETKYTYNSRNQLVTEETDGEETVCSYDANGNLLNRSGASADETYGYGAYDRLISYVADHGAKQETYSYDAEGVRRSKTSLNGEKETDTVFVSDTSGELSRTLAETDETGSLLTAYTWGDTLLAQTRDGKTSTYLYDGHGDVRGLLDGKGILTDTYSYNAYGELTEKTGETENHFLYTGEYYDGMSGLYYLRARYMNPETGTFISMDSYQGDMYEPVTLHKYLYANADPVTYTDPSGMFSLSECNLVSAIGAELYQSRFAIMGMAIMNRIGKSAMTALSGGDLGEVSMALLEGIAEGSAMGMLFCAVAAITVTSMAAVFMSVVAADSIVSIVIAIRSVMDGDYMNALVYGAFAVVGIIGVCKWYKMNYRVNYVGDKGIATFDEIDDICTNTVWDNIVPTQPNIPGTEIPKSFKIRSNGGQSFWVHANATKHMGEYITRKPMSHGMPMESQGMLASFESAVDTVVAQGVIYEDKMWIDNWELVFSQPRGEGLLPVIYHAVYIP